MMWSQPVEIYVGRHRAAPRILSDVEIECEALFAQLRHLVDGRSVADSWRLAEIEAQDLRLARVMAERS